MKPTPPGWPRISSSLYYDDAKAAIDWLCRAFGFELRLLVEGEGGTVEHSELVCGDGVVMVGSTARSKTEKFPYRKSPPQVGGGNTQNLFMYVDDVDAHAKRAREAGATIELEPEVHDYGEDYWSDRTYGCVDVGGHHWWFSQRLRSPEPKKK
jgi:uncharacterized glyoxalase superfamily protein PhnB